jgi:predicted ArsR family transcriptional regulator
MAEIEVPFRDEPSPSTIDTLNEIVDDQGPVRLTELEEQLSVSDRELRFSLMQLVERGDAALFPVGDTVQVRSEN